MVPRQIHHKWAQFLAQLSLTQPLGSLINQEHKGRKRTQAPMDQKRLSKVQSIITKQEEGCFHLGTP